MRRGGRQMAFFVLAQLLCLGHSMRRPASTALAAFQVPLSQSYSVSRVMTWCTDGDGRMQKVEKEVQKRGLFDGEKWRSDTTVTEWENGEKKRYETEGDLDLSIFPLPNLQNSLTGDMLPLFGMEDMLEDAFFPRVEIVGPSRIGAHKYIPSGSDALQTEAARPTRRIDDPSASDGEASSREGEMAANTEPSRESPSGLLEKVAGGLRQGSRELAGNIASVTESNKNSVCDATAPSFQSESKTVELRVSDGKIQGKEILSKFVDGKWETAERPLEREVVDGLRAEKAWRAAAGLQQHTASMAQTLDIEAESKS